MAKNIIMKRIAIALCTTCILFACNNGTDSAAKTEEKKMDSTVKESQPKNGEWIPVDSATAMKTMMDMGTPGPEHAMLAKFDGRWNAETTMWMADGAPPMVSKNNSATYKMIMGGRYQQTSFKGDMMGMPYEGAGITGYDKAKKVFFTSWMDNMSTMVMNMEGTWDEASKSITFTGKMLCPANGQMCDMKEVTKMMDNNTQVMEMYGPDMKTGKMYKNMEIKFTRSK